MAKTDGNVFGNINDLPIWFRILLSLSLLGGSVSGIGFVTTDDKDRYYASAAASDLALRDARIKANQRDIIRIEKRLDIIDQRIQEESREAEQDLKSHAVKSKH